MKTIPIRITRRTYRAVRKGANLIFAETILTPKNAELSSELHRIADELKDKGAPTK